MRRSTIIAYFAVLLIAAINAYYYFDLYRKQIYYITKQLDRQVQILGQEINETNFYFTSDLNAIDFSNDVGKFFDEKEVRDRAIEKLKLYYIKYQNLITNIAIINEKTEVFNISIDDSRIENRKSIFTNDDVWLINTFTTHDQLPIYQREDIILEDSKYSLYQPIFSNGKVIANFKITFDYRKYFTSLLDQFESEQYQWQWVIDDTGLIVMDNFELFKGFPGLKGVSIDYKNYTDIVKAVNDGASGHKEEHRVIINGEAQRTIISSYSAVGLLDGRLSFGLIFSAPIDIFQVYLIKRSIGIVISTVLLVIFIIVIFRKGIRKQQSEVADAKDTEKMLNRLIEEMPVGVIIYNSGREILKANKVASKFYSYDNEADMVDKIYPEPFATDESNYFSKYMGGKFSPDDFVIIRKEIGEQVLFRSSIPVKYKGVDSTMEILIDVTMLESARNLEAKANTAKSEFLARMSYEIRTPLNGIIGMADMMGKLNLDPSANEMVTILRRSTELLLSIINDILDFSQIESGKVILDETPFDLRQELNHCLDHVQNRMEGKKIKITHDIDGTIPDSLIGDPFRLRQVLINIMQFSIQKTEEGEISCVCRQKSNKEGLVSIEFDLKNTGKAHSKAELKTIFGDFVQAESISLRNSDGSSVGTVLARQLIEMMGGTLNAASPAGLSADPAKPGTRILITLPFYSNERVEITYDTDKIRSFSEINALSICGVQSRDEDIIGMLHRAGIPTVVTSWQKSTINQIEANYKNEKEPYNLIILADDNDLNGFEVADSLMKSGFHMRYPIIMISAEDIKGNYLKCINLGIDHYLTKPLSIDELREAILLSFPNIEDPLLSVDLKSVKTGLDVLVVEDNKINSMVTGRMLSSLGYEPHFAFDGAEAVKMAESRKYDLIFMDLVMPVMDGYEATKHILSHDKSVLIIALTADNMPETRKKAELYGLKEFISKPMRLDSLKTVLRKFFGENQNISE